MQQKMRVPETMFMRGNFSGTGRTDWVVQLYEPASESAACDYVLIVSDNKGIWERFFFGKIHLNEAWRLLWYSKRRALAIDVGERRRRSAPAQMFWSDGSESFQAGFVVEDALIKSWLEWDQEQKRYVQKDSDSAEWWEIEQQ
ncbi:MAG: hypothetical protein ACRD1T_10650 [Acidimicrobiia bacterium]